MKNGFNRSPSHENQWIPESHFILFTYSKTLIIQCRFIVIPAIRDRSHGLIKVLSTASSKSLWILIVLTNLSIFTLCDTTILFTSWFLIKFNLRAKVWAKLRILRVLSHWFRRNTKRPAFHTLLTLLLFDISLLNSLLDRLVTLPQSSGFYAIWTNWKWGIVISR